MKTNVKINLGLNVLRRREDGYHDIETLFVPYDGLGDELSVTPADTLSIDILSGAPVGWAPEEDLTMKAWRLLKTDFPALPPVHIRLRKGAPVGAGLGGGSADAAACLQALNRLFSLGLNTEMLAGYASRLGADCAFFLYNRPMLGEGRGDRLTPFPIDLGAYEIRVAMPDGISVSTAQAYRGVLEAKKRADLPEIPLREALRYPVPAWKAVLKNDFEATVFPQFPAIAALKQAFYEDGAVYAAMSGSGAAVFGLFAR
ncbi:MAG: 4-(cytidine 5'-diphospho)-2-C-methyl-D-erythritol kinase [Bacteroidales bacterium]|nr:4-(cytidine 5'-diphospho)-2-C-methyl-D-erythritol kinase [Bacteroidales bacterium]